MFLRSKTSRFHIKKQLIITVSHQFPLHTTRHSRIVHCNTITYGRTQIMPIFTSK